MKNQISGTRILFAAMIITVLSACRSEHRARMEFIEKYGIKALDSLKNAGIISIIVRSFERDGMTVMVQMRDEKPIFWTRISTAGKIIETSWNQAAMRLPSDTITLDNLILSFRHHRLKYYAADSVGNTWLSFFSNERPEMVHFSSPQKTPSYCKDWKSLGNNWLEAQE